MNQRGNGNGSGWDADDWGSGPATPSGTSGPYQGPSEGTWQLPDTGSYPVDSAAHGSEPLPAGFPSPGGYPQSSPGGAEDYGYYDGGESYYAAAPAESGRRGGIGWIIPVLVLAIVAVTALGVYVLTTNNSDSAPTAAPASPTQHAPGSGSSEPADPSSAGQSSTPPSSTAVESSAAESTSPQPEPEQSDDSALPAGLTTHGWTGKITCNAADEWVYAGGNGADYAVVCRATPGGGLYYRGLFRGGTVEHDIAEYTLGTSPSFHTVPAGDTSVYIHGSDLTVFGAGDAVLAETSFSTSLVR